MKAKGKTPTRPARFVRLVMIPESLHKQAERYASKNEMTIEGVITRALIGYLPKTGQLQK